MSDAENRLAHRAITYQARTRTVYVARCACGWESDEHGDLPSADSAYVAHARRVVERKASA